MNIERIAAQIDNGNSDLLELLGLFNNYAQDLDLRYLAYMLATTWHETAHTFKPIEERGNKAYFMRYEPNTEIGKRLGNKLQGDGFKYRGRGYCQITGLNNYRKFESFLNIPLVKSPEFALQPFYAFLIMLNGMQKGMFTGKKLADYFNENETDWLNARRIINGTDKAQLIANKAREFFEILKAEV